MKATYCAKNYPILQQHCLKEIGDVTLDDCRRSLFASHSNSAVIALVGFCTCIQCHTNKTLKRKNNKAAGLLEVLLSWKTGNGITDAPVLQKPQQEAAAHSMTGMLSCVFSI